MKKEKKSMIILEISAMIFLIVGLILYFIPLIYNLVYIQKVEKIKDYYVKDVEENDYQELYNELKKRNNQLFIDKQKELTDPFSYEQANIDLQEYGLKNNIIGFISIPKINIELPIYLGANKENMLKGAVHLTQTSYPIGGINTNAVIAAHRGYKKADMFKNIDKIKIGDNIYIKNFMGELNYRVIDIKIIMPNEIDKLLIQEGKDLITLITCHPYRYNYQRYVVYCERVQ